jgi:hypothetical protein
VVRVSAQVRYEAAQGGSELGRLGKGIVSRNALPANSSDESLDVGADAGIGNGADDVAGIREVLARLRADGIGELDESSVEAGELGVGDAGEEVEGGDLNERVVHRVEEGVGAGRVLHGENLGSAGQGLVEQLLDCSTSCEKLVHLVGVGVGDPICTMSVKESQVLGGRVGCTDTNVDNGVVLNTAAIVDLAHTGDALDQLQSGLQVGIILQLEEGQGGVLCGSHSAREEELNDRDSTQEGTHLDR